MSPPHGYDVSRRRRRGHGQEAPQLGHSARVEAQATGDPGHAIVAELADHLHCSMPPSLLDRETQPDQLVETILRIP